MWNETSFILKNSLIQGVGVFSTVDLPARTQVLINQPKPRLMKIKDVPPEFQKYCVFINEEDCMSPARFDAISVGWYVNHSDQPNIEQRTISYIITLRDIKAGEEILVDYNHPTPGFKPHKRFEDTGRILSPY